MAKSYGGKKSGAKSPLQGYKGECAHGMVTHTQGGGPKKGKFKGPTQASGRRSGSK